MRNLQLDVEEATQIRGAMPYAENLDAVVHRLVKDDVSAGGKRAKADENFVALPADQRMTEEQLEFFPEGLEQAFSAFGILSGDILPDFEQVFLGALGYAVCFHRFLLLRLAFN